MARWGTSPLVGALAIGAGAGALGGLVLSLLAQAPGQRERVAALQEMAARIASGGRAQAQPPPATHCRMPPDRAASEVAAALRASALAAGLVLEALEFTGLERPPAGTAGAELTMKLRGQEAQVTAFIRTSADAKLPVFLDTFDLTRGPAGVQVEFSGRLLCRRMR